MEQQEIETIVRGVLQELFTKKHLTNLRPEKEKLTIIPSERHSFNALTNQLQQALNAQYQLKIETVEAALRSKPQKSLLLDLSLSEQAKAALGIADSPITLFLQQAFIEKREVQVFTNNLVALNEIGSFNYRKIMAHYQRCLKEYGLIFTNQDSLQQTQAKKQFYTATDIEPLARGSTLELKEQEELSYGAKVAIANKKIIVRRLKRGDKN